MQDVACTPTGMKTSLLAAASKNALLNPTKRRYHPENRANAYDYNRLRVSRGPVEDYKAFMCVITQTFNCVVPWRVSYPGRRAVVESPASHCSTLSDRINQLHQISPQQLRTSPNSQPEIIPFIIYHESLIPGTVSSVTPFISDHFIVADTTLV